MAHDDHDWITVHRAKFAQPMDATEQNFSGPPGASCARIGVDTHLDANGMPVLKSDIWGAWTICHNRKIAEQIINDPGSQFPLLRGAIETWHCLLVPYTHHGDVNWRGVIESGSALRLASGPASGAIAVMTTAAYRPDTSIDPSRIQEFMQNVWRTRDYFCSCKGNRGAALFPSCDDRDGITFTLWESEAHMVSAAYGAGMHFEQLKHHRTKPFFDRSSFTRARVISMSGKWDGRCPLESAITETA